MSDELCALFVTYKPEEAKKIIDGLAPELRFNKTEQTNSIMDAFKRHSATKYHACFITDSEAFAKDLESFFRDIRTMGRHKECVFVQARSTKISKDLNRAPLVAMGFQAFLSPIITPDEKKDLLQRMAGVMQQRDMLSQLEELDSFVNYMLKEIDNVSQERKRGRTLPLNNSMKNFVSLTSESNQHLIDHYYQKLIDRSASWAPVQEYKLALPDELRNRLPGVTAEGYRGTSKRVLRRLNKAYGVKNLNAQKESLDDADEDVDESHEERA